MNISSLRQCGWINPTSDIGFMAAKPSSRPHMKIKASNLKSYVKRTPVIGVNKQYFNKPRLDLLVIIL